MMRNEDTGSSSRKVITHGSLEVLGHSNSSPISNLDINRSIEDDLFLSLFSIFTVIHLEYNL